MPFEVILEKDFVRKRKHILYQLHIKYLISLDLDLDLYLELDWDNVQVYAQSGQKCLDRIKLIDFFNFLFFSFLFFPLVSSPLLFPYFPSFCLFFGHSAFQIFVSSCLYIFFFRFRSISVCALIHILQESIDPAAAHRHISFVRRTCRLLFVSSNNKP